VSDLVGYAGTPLIVVDVSWSGDIVWAHEELQQMLGQVAEIVVRTISLNLFNRVVVCRD
jgi:hypothetical protein